MDPARSKIRGPNGRAGRILGSLFCLAFLGMGLLFSVFVGLEFVRSAETHRWTRTECVILESAVAQDGTGEQPYRFRVRYAYDWQGTPYTSERSTLSTSSFAEYDKARRLAEQHPADTKGVCYVNPRNPAEAVLEPAQLWIGLAILLPLIFVGVGAVGLAAIWRGTRPDPASAPRAEPLSRPSSAAGLTRAGTGFQVAFFAVFFLAGVAVCYFLLIRPLAGLLAARSWAATPCTILSSQLRSHHSSDSTTYSVDIFYSYEVNGREYRSNRYKFSTGSSSGTSGKQEILRRFRPGSRTVCYVDPRDPGAAVLERGLTGDLWFGLVPALFILVGAGGVAGTLRKRRALQARATAATSDPVPAPVRDIIGAGPAPSASFVDVDPAEPRLLKPSGSRLGMAIGMGVAAAIWNGVLFFGFVQDRFRRRHDNVFDWIFTLFLLPFLVVGVGLVVVALRQLLALSNPTADITIRPGAPVLGGSLAMSWRLMGRTRALRGLNISLEAREEATHRQGTRSHTDRKQFLKLDLASMETLADMLAGRTEITLPADTIPSFKSDNNRIVWCIHLRGDIPRWPDLDEEFEITVRPIPRNAITRPAVA